MKVNIHAGHNAPRKIACGAVGYIDESREARRVKERVKRKLRKLGHIVYDCTENNGKSQSDVLKKIVKKCNKHEVDLDISIHFNACETDTGNGKTKGVEVLLCNANSKAKKYALAIANRISETLGIVNRGVKYRPDLYFLRKTKAPALLVEVCFVDDADDVEKYDADKTANAIVNALESVK